MEKEIELRLNSIEHQLHFFSEAYKNLHNMLIRGDKINVTSDSINREVDRLKQERLSLHHLMDEFKEEGVLASIKFMAKHIYEIQQELHAIKNDGMTKKIHLDLTMEGYEMVKRTPSMDELEMIKIKEYDADLAMQNLLKELPTKERLVLLHRFGLLGEKVKTLQATGKALGITREPVRRHEIMALRRLRHPTRKHLVDQITHKKLKEAITEGKQ